MSKVIPQNREWDFVQLHYEDTGESTVNEIERLLRDSSYRVVRGYHNLKLLQDEDKKVAIEGDYVLLQKDIGVVLVLNELEMTRMFRKTFRSN